MQKVKTLENITVVLENERTGERRILKTHNIVTNAGDVYYAQMGAGESPTNAFGILELGTDGDAPGKTSNRSNMTTKVTGSQKVFDATYPQTDDGDSDNPDAATDVTTYRVSYTTSEANATGIDRLIITNATPGASEPVMTYAEFAAPFDKTSSDTLKVFVNHDFTGV
jgi:hypothetical protein